MGTYSADPRTSGFALSSLPLHSRLLKEGQQDDVLERGVPRRTLMASGGRI